MPVRIRIIEIISYKLKVWFSNSPIVHYHSVIFNKKYSKNVAIFTIEFSSAYVKFKVKRSIYHTFFTNKLFFFTFVLDLPFLNVFKATRHYQVLSTYRDPGFSGFCHWRDKKALIILKVQKHAKLALKTLKRCVIRCWTYLNL